MAARAQAAACQSAPVDKWAAGAEQETDSDSAGEETTTPTTVSEAGSYDICTEESEVEVPQLGPGLYHDDIDDITPSPHATADAARKLAAGDCAEAMYDSYDSDGDDDEAASTCQPSSSSRSTSRGEAAPSATLSPEDTLFVFDWDDTILPSSWVNSQGLRLDERAVVLPEQRRFLAELSDLAATTLRMAQRFGTVIIVTNAERGWIELSCAKFMPTLMPLLETIRIVSARTSYEGRSAPSPVDWKVCAFEAEIAKFYGLDCYEECRPKNVFSLGDGAHEREALLRTTPSLPNCRAKSLKFAERPDIHQVIKQHTLVQGCLETMVHHDGHLDLITRCD